MGGYYQFMKSSAFHNIPLWLNCQWDQPLRTIMGKIKHPHSLFLNKWTTRCDWSDRNLTP